MPGHISTKRRTAPAAVPVVQPDLPEQLEQQQQMQQQQQQPQLQGTSTVQFHSQQPESLPSAAARQRPTATAGLTALRANFMDQPPTRHSSAPAASNHSPIAAAPPRQHDSLGDEFHYVAPNVQRKQVVQVHTLAVQRSVQKQFDCNSLAFFLPEGLAPQAENFVKDARPLPTSSAFLAQSFRLLLSLPAFLAHHVLTPAGRACISPNGTLFATHKLQRDSSDSSRTQRR